MERGKRTFRTLIALVLILALAVTGLGYPGFMIPLLMKKAKNNVPDEAKTVVTADDVRGNSRAFTLEPCDGFTISAEANALDRDREWNVERLDGDQINELQTAMYDTDYHVMVYDAWEVDAGLEDNEMFPGQYKMEFDLEELGIPEDLWDGVFFIRRDDSGKLYEYCTQRTGSKVTVMSRQNSIIECVIAFSLLVGPSVDTIVAAKSGVSFSYKSTYIPVKDDQGNHLFNLKVTRHQLIIAICEQMKLLEAPILESAYAASVREMKRLYGDTWKEQGKEKERQEAELDYARMKAKNSPDYMALKNDLDKYLKEYLYGEELEVIESTKKYMIMARSYLMNVVGVQMPDYVMDVELSGKMTSGAAGVTISPFIGHPYCVFDASKIWDSESTDIHEAYDQLLLTIVHEFMHASQRTYLYESLANFKFDEAIAQLVEQDALAYFSSTYDGEGKITHTQGMLKNLDALEFYALPLDSFDVTFGDGYSHTVKGDKQADASYPIAPFIRYVWQKHKPDMTYDDIMNKYKGYTRPAITTLLKEIFGISEAELTEDYFEFMKVNQLNMYNRAVKNQAERKTRYYNPSLFCYSNKISRVDLTNNNYTTRVRHLYPESDDGDEIVRMLVVQDEKFEEMLPDTKLIPVGSTKVTNCKYGAVTELKRSGDMDFWMMEVDGGSARDGWFSGTGKSGYTVYTMRAPSIGAGTVEDGLFKFNLPEKSRMAEAGYIDGYRVTIKSSDGVETVRYYKIDGAGEEIGLRITRISNVKAGDNSEDAEPVSFTLSVCEYIREPDGRRIFGPDSDGARTMEQNMDDMLNQMGALTGKITISMGWGTEDDLDLHCTTPSGSEIYYGNKDTGGGHLDVDMNAHSDELSTNPVENIYFENPDPGDYHIWVDNYCDRTEGGDSAAIVRVTIGDQQFIYRLTLGGSAEVMRFTYGEDETVEIGDEYLDH